MENSRFEFRGLNHLGVWVYGLPSQQKQGDNGTMWGDVQYCYQFSLKTLGQYTGLKDKNGVKIFEGDVVKGTAYEAEIYTGEVAYLDSEASFIMKIIGSKGHFRLNNQTFQALEVVGNKFENPELLNAE